MVCATYFLELDPVLALGHAVDAYLPYWHVFHFPTVLIGGRILCIVVRDDQDRMYRGHRAMYLTVHLKALAQGGAIPLLGELINPELNYTCWADMHQAVRNQPVRHRADAASMAWRSTRRRGARRREILIYAQVRRRARRRWRVRRADAFWHHVLDDRVS